MSNLANIRGWLLAAIAVLAVGLTGCADDLYAPCDLDPADVDPVTRACATEASSCAIENYPQCDTTICGRFEGSEPFCTQTCASDSDCPAGVCAQFTVGVSTRYCVDESIL